MCDCIPVLYKSAHLVAPTGFALVVHPGRTSHHLTPVYMSLFLQIPARAIVFVGRTSALALCVLLLHALLFCRGIRDRNCKVPFAITGVRGRFRPGFGPIQEREMRARRLCPWPHHQGWGRSRLVGSAAQARNLLGIAMGWCWSWLASGESVARGARARYRVLYRGGRRWRHGAVCWSVAGIHSWGNCNFQMGEDHCENGLAGGHKLKRSTCLVCIWILFLVYKHIVVVFIVFTLLETRGSLFDIGFNMCLSGRFSNSRGRASCFAFISPLLLMVMTTVNRTHEPPQIYRILHLEEGDMPVGASTLPPE